MPRLSVSRGDRSPAGAIARSFPGISGFVGKVKISFYIQRDWEMSGAESVSGATLPFMSLRESTVRPVMGVVHWRSKWPAGITDARFKRGGERWLVSAGADAALEISSIDSIEAADVVCCAYFFAHRLEEVYRRTTESSMCQDVAR